MSNDQDRNYDYTPISMWGYFGYQILFAIPIVGLILAIVWSFGAHNINLRNFARSRFCIMIILIIIVAILAATGVIGSIADLYF